MSRTSLLDLASERTVLLDGALGTELMARGLSSGSCPEAWNVDRPDILRDIHRAYFEAGSDAVSTNSFGGNPIALASHGLESRCRELNLAAARIATAARPDGKFILGSVGPTGKFLKPQGEQTEEDFERAFGVQVAALAEGGVDGILIETMFDLREALCAVRSAQRMCALPVYATMTFNKTKRGFFTFMGDSPAKCIASLTALGVAALGANCTLTGSDLAGVIAELRQHTHKPLIAQPNAGQPEIKGATCEVVYSQGIEEYTASLPRLVSAGANIIGGCCGSNPEYIRRAAAWLKARTP